MDQLFRGTAPTLPIPDAAALQLSDLKLDFVTKVDTLRTPIAPEAARTNAMARAFKRLGKTAAFNAARPLFGPNTWFADVFAGIGTIAHADRANFRPTAAPATQPHPSNPVNPTPQQSSSAANPPIVPSYLQAAHRSVKPISHLPPILHGQTADSAAITATTPFSRSIANLIMCTANRLVGHEKHKLMPFKDFSAVGSERGLREALLQGRMSGSCYAMRSTNLDTPCLLAESQHLETVETAYSMFESVFTSHGGRTPEMTFGMTDDAKLHFCTLSLIRKLLAPALNERFRLQDD